MASVYVCCSSDTELKYDGGQSIFEAVLTDPGLKPFKQLQPSLSASTTPMSEKPLLIKIATPVLAKFKVTSDHFFRHVLRYTMAATDLTDGY
jgi:hypothetical protein